MVDKKLILSFLVALLVAVSAAAQSTVSGPTSYVGAPFSGGLTGIAATLTQIVAAPSAGSLYVTDIAAASTTATAGLLLLRYGTGANCGTGTTTLYPNIAAQTTGVLPYPANTSPPLAIPLTTPIKVPAGNAVCVICVATNTCTVNVSGFTAP